MDKFVIAITRTCGSGATSIGKILAKNLGVEIYDRNILRLASAASARSCSPERMRIRSRAFCSGRPRRYIQEA